MSVILPVNINNIEDINDYNNLTAYEQDFINSQINQNFQISDTDNYDLLMTMYENQYTSAIIDNTDADFDLSSLNDDISILF